MKKLYAPSTIADIKSRHDFRLSKSLGQNFITDKNVIEKIVEGAERSCHRDRPGNRSAYCGSGGNGM